MRAFFTDDTSRFAGFSSIEAWTPGWYQILRDNPFVKFHNAERGYVLCNASSKEWRTDFRVVEFVDRLGAPVLTRASFVVENGRPGLQS